MMLQPVSLAQSRPIALHDGVIATTTDVWAMLSASHAGDLARVLSLAGACPALVTCQYDYTSPLHLAVRAGHLDIVRFLITAGGIDPDYRVHPFDETLHAMATDRGFETIAALVARSLETPALVRARGDTGRIDYQKTDEEREFERLVDAGDCPAVAAMLRARPDLARDPDFFWGEGILAMPAKDGNVAMVDLLMDAGATVPAVSKWGARYYFKHLPMATHLLDRGMSPDHMSWRRFTLLHDFAFTGELDKLSLLLGRGAAIDSIDDEFLSTPLGHAAHWGREAVVAELLRHGADPIVAGAPWATPLQWARRRGHASIATALWDAGARS